MERMAHSSVYKHRAKKYIELLTIWLQKPDNIGREQRRFTVDALQFDHHSNRAAQGRYYRFKLKETLSIRKVRSR
jgi:hypothetical protein